MKLLTLILSCLYLTQVNAAGLDYIDGSSDSGGGDAYALEFTLLGYQAVEIIRDSEVKEVTPGDFLDIIAQTKVMSQERLFLNGAEVDAINTPSQKTIQLSRIRWDDIQNQQQMKFKLVIHEYLGVLGVDDSKYQLTDKIFSTKKSPTIDIECIIDSNSSRKASYRINLFKNSQPIVTYLPINTPKRVSSIERTFKAVSAGDVNGIVHGKTTGLSVSFLMNSHHSVTVPLKYTKPAFGDLVPQVKMLELVDNYSGDDEFKLKTVNLTCTQFKN